ncbi:hypothetical protein Tco_0361845, partial [Tanacetum coccineum]
MEMEVTEEMEMEVTEEMEMEEMEMKGMEKTEMEIEMGIMVVNYGGFMPVARECTFQDFLKCKPHNFSGTEGINSQKRTIDVDAAYAMNWAKLIRLMTEVYCLRNEIQKM